MPAQKAPLWTSQEIAILRQEYPGLGIDIADLLPERSWQAIYVMANRLGLHSTRIAAAPTPKLSGDRLEQAITLREVEGWSFARIGAKFGVAEVSAANAVLIALCPRKGFTPAERDRHGRLTEAGRDRVRYALKKGLKGVDIQLRLGVSAACVSEQRRRYNRELKERGKALLPPPGGGEAYSGVKLSRSKIAEVETLFRKGLGTQKISQQLSVSKTSCTRIRNRLIARLRRKGETLAGCDAAGTRRVQGESARFVTDEQRKLLRMALLEATPVRRAAKSLALGGSTAYRIRDELSAELQARGDRLPEPSWRGDKIVPPERYWPPNGPSALYAFRVLLKDFCFAEAKARWIADREQQQEAERLARQAERNRPRSFDEQLARVEAGQIALAANVNRRRDLDLRVIKERAA